MKIEKGHYVPKELITSEALHEAVVKCFVAAGFVERDEYGQMPCPSCFSALGVNDLSQGICWTNSGTPLTLQQLFTAENGLQWPDGADSVISFGGDCVAFVGDDVWRIISGKMLGFKTKMPLALATRQPKEREVKTIKDAVIEFNGIWPEQAKDSKWFIVLIKKLDGSHSELKLDKDKFEACAKRLGYINGYRWGVEYPTNGKRPDLADDVEIEGLTPCLWNKCAVSTMWWNMVRSFRITDQRYKPADTSYLKASTQAQSLTRSEEWLTHSDWFDYEMHKAVNPAPVGTKLIVDCFDKGWKDAVVIGSFERWNWIDIAGVGLETVDLCRIKPLDHATRKAELEREKVIEAAFKVASGGLTKEMYSALYDAGMLVLPPKKSDTKD